MKVYISVDMEGMAGAVVGDHMGGSGDYERFRHIMTAEANAAVEGALAAGASEVVVNDSHGPMTNILIEELNPDAELISVACPDLAPIIQQGFPFDRRVVDTVRAYCAPLGAAGGRAAITAAVNASEGVVR